METCVVSLGGFNSDLTPTTTSLTTTTSSLFSGVFNGDGTGSETAQEVTVVAPPFASGSSDTVSFDFTYTVAADRTVTVSIPVINGQSLTGPVAGQTFTITNTASTTGKLSDDGRSVTFSTTDPTIDTLTFSGGLVEQRICALSGTSIKVNDRTDNSGADQP
jgi:hypothetical protein